MNELFRAVNETLNNTIDLFAKQETDGTEWKMACLCLIAMSSQLLGILQGIMEVKNDSNNNTMHHFPPSGGKTAG